MIGDPELKIAKLYGMLPAESGNTSEGRTAADNATVRTVFVVGPDKKIKLQLSYPMSTGRNFDEVLRVIDSMQLTAKHKVATPVNWKKGDDVIILPRYPTKKRNRNIRRMESAQALTHGSASASLTCGGPGRTRKRDVCRASPYGNSVPREAQWQNRTGSSSSSRLTKRPF